MRKPINWRAPLNWRPFLVEPAPQGGGRMKRFRFSDEQMIGILKGFDPPPTVSRREDRPPLLDGLHHRNVADLRRWDLQRVTVQDNEVSKLADF
jgi:hypothetical protein